MTAIEATIVTKAGGALTKKIWLDPDGNVHADSACCVMTGGAAKRWRGNSVQDLAEAIVGLTDCDALTLGALAPSLPDRVRITTQRRLNGAAKPDLITRTAGNWEFRAGMPALALVDFDVKGMPAEVATRIAAAGGFWRALCSVMPTLASVARVERASTSAGLYRADTGEQLPGSTGAHVYLLVRDGTDIERFLKDLHARCWLAGMGWAMLGAAGQMLERSIVDRTVGSPERLVFEGPPLLIAPLQQAPRQPIAHDGEDLDTRDACPPLSPIEETRLAQLRAAESVRLRPEAERVRHAYIRATAQRLGISERIVARRCNGVLRPETVLDFDDDDLAGATVADVLREPDRYIGETLGDPIEGVAYGRGRAKILRRGDALIVHSLAHGISSVYVLKHDRPSIEALVRAAAPDEALSTLIDNIVLGDLDPAEVEQLLKLGCELTGTGKRDINKALKLARQAAEAAHWREERERRRAERRDPRPQLAVPPDDDEAEPVAERLNGILGAAPNPMRNAEGLVARVRDKSFPSLHLLITEEVNPDAE
jgi:hypothetical protein